MFMDFCPASIESGHVKCRVSDSAEGLNAQEEGNSEFGTRSCSRDCGGEVCDCTILGTPADFITFAGVGRMADSSLEYMVKTPIFMRRAATE